MKVVTVAAIKQLFALLGEKSVRCLEINKNFEMPFFISPFMRL